MAINPKVSVLITTYNQEKFIAKTIQSVLQQDYDNFEMIISDDASNDGNLKIIEHYAQLYPSKIIMLKNSERGGITINSQRGLIAATGDLVAFIAGDDLWLPGKLTAQVNWFKNHPDYSICYHDVAIFDFNKKQIIGLYSDSHKKMQGTAAEVLYHRCFISCISMMIKKTAIPDSGYNEKFSNCSDWFLVVDTLINSGDKIGFIDQVYAYYNRHENNVTKTNKYLYLEAIMAYKEYKYKYKEYNDHFDLCLAEELITGIIKSAINKNLKFIFYCSKELLRVNIHNVFKALFRISIVAIKNIKRKCKRKRESIYVKF